MKIKRWNDFLSYIKESKTTEKFGFWKIEEDDIRDYFQESIDEGYNIEVRYGFVGEKRTWNYKEQKSDYLERFTKKMLSGKNKPAILSSTYGGNINLAFRPETPWKGISKIKIYTNLVNGNQTNDTSVRLLAGGNVNYYSPYDNSFLSNGQGQDENELFFLSIANPIAGTAVTGSTQYTSANMGDAGTLWTEKVAHSDQYNSNVNLGGAGGTFIGNKDLNDVPYPYGLTYDDSDNEITTGTIVHSSYSSYISFQIQPFAYDFDYGTVPDFKFKFIIEYYQ